MYLGNSPRPGMRDGRDIGKRAKPVVTERLTKAESAKRLCWLCRLDSAITKGVQTPGKPIGIMNPQCVAMARPNHGQPPLLRRRFHPTSSLVKVTLASGPMSRSPFWFCFVSRYATRANNPSQFQSRSGNRLSSCRKHHLCFLLYQLFSCAAAIREIHYRQRSFERRQALGETRLE